MQNDHTTEERQECALPVLNWRQMPLDGRILIEASAGTGKTWNISLIYLRLLLERELTVQQILMTTFTDAAAQELRERLRWRLIDAERWLSATTLDVDCNDALQNYLAEYCDNDEKMRQALRRIQLARADLDRAPVSTIHALCQRIQRDYPLESGASFATDKLFDDQQLQRECVEDFWRRRYLAGAIDPREAELLLKDGPDGLLRDLIGLANNTDARIEAGGLTELEQQLASLNTTENITELQRLVDDVTLYKRSTSALRSRLREIAAALQDNDEAQLVKSLTDVFEPGKLAAQEALTHAGELAGNPLIRALQRLQPIAGLRKTFTRGNVLAEAAKVCREELPQRARQRHVMTYSMLIDSVYERLCGEHSDNVLANRLFKAFPVALIDEFQDTDQRQFAIFDRIYRERGTLVMIGDPKQAIYSFRGGDIAAYLRASQLANQRFSLGTNHRSSRALVEAMNAWYRHTDGGFNHPQIRYQHVVAAGKADDVPYTIDCQPVANPLVIHPFRGDATGKPLTALGQLESLALDDCANRIAELLNDPRQHIGEQRVTPGDIAVLLSTNSQIMALRKRLISRGVPCVGSGRGNIFAGEISRELTLILFAVLHPDDDQAVRGALATCLLGATLTQFNTWREEPAAFDRELERFETWRALICSRGVLILIEQLLAERATALLALSDGERIITDLRHLGELLAEKEASHQGLDGLYAWLMEMRQEGSDGDTEAADDRQLRIESDSRRVQLLTIHASKGLEFPIVFLPLIWRISTRDGIHAPKLLRYHDENGERCVDLGSTHFTEHLGKHFREELEERLRLLYVALTRAIHAVHVYWVDRGPLPTDDAHAWQSAAIDLLLRQAQQKLELSVGEATLKPMADAIGGMTISAPYADVFTCHETPAEADALRATQTPLPRVRAFQWSHSFSSLTRHASITVTVDADRMATDENDIGYSSAIPNVETSPDNRLLALYPLRGPRFGDAVHHVFELAQPGPIWPQQRHLVHAQLVAQAITSSNMTAEEALEQVSRMIDRARQTDLGDGLRLNDMGTDQRIVEFAFQFPVRHVSLAQLRRLCSKHGHADVIPASLDSSTLNGMLAGFADLIIAWNGRYHVLDYKTNWLGSRVSDYVGSSLVAAMVEHHYPLQALLYSVALHRYLRQRLDGYLIERHMGDSWYLFVRALGLAPDAGVWRRRWPAALVEALDDAFAGGQEYVS